MNTTPPNTEKSRPSYVDKNITKQILQREVTYHAELKNYNAHPTPLCFVDEISSNRALVAGLTLSQTLQSHRGCVNSVTWSEKGDLLVSGSDDTKICIWDYHEGGRLRTKIDSGHTANIFCTRFMPNTNNSWVVSCAGDFQFRVFNTETNNNSNSRSISPFKVYDCCQGRVKKFCPLDSWSFLLVAEDGTVREVDMRQSHQCETPACEKTKLVELKQGHHVVELYSIGLSGNYFCVGGGDPLVRVYDRRYLSDAPRSQKTVKKFAPRHLASNANAEQLFSIRGHITGVAFENDEILASYSGDHIYLFDMNESHDVSQDTNENKSNSNSDDEFENLSDDETKHKRRKRRKIASREEKSSEDEENDNENNNNEDEDNDENKDEDDEMDLTQVPVHSNYHTKRYMGHCNVRTVKEVNFYGPRNEYVISGSDDGNIFIWHKDEAKIVNILKGDKHVVNCIQGHPHMPILASSGIENDVKLWAPTARKADGVSNRNIEEEFASVSERNMNKLQDSTRSQAMPLSMFRALLRTLGERRRQRQTSNTTNAEDNVMNVEENEEDDNEEEIQIAFGSDESDEEGEGGAVQCGTQ
jgi:WD repeat-containing protein 42A